MNFMKLMKIWKFLFNGQIYTWKAAKKLAKVEYFIRAVVLSAKNIS